MLLVENLCAHFANRRNRRAVIRAVEDVSFSLERGRTLGVVGESGCGKSTLARTILRLIPATSGRVIFDGHDVLAASTREMRALRRRMQIVFQDPAGSLNPRLSVEWIVGEALHVHGIVRSANERRERVGVLLRRVGLRPEDMRRWPHEFSGGQRQRIGIARALALEPELLICDEPVSALDVSIQSQILNLLADLQEALGLSLLFIAHDLAVVEHFCDETIVMYLGRIVERAPTADLFRSPRHPYTQALLAAAPVLTPGERTERSAPPGEPASPLAPPKGCAFHPRCPHTEPRCREQRPALRALEDGAARLVACHLAE